MRCNHCGKEIPYEQCAVDFMFFRTDEDMNDNEKDIYRVPLSSDYPRMKFTQNFVAPCLCYDCCKELEDYLVEFVNEK